VGSWKVGKLGSWKVGKLGRWEGGKLVSRDVSVQRVYRVGR